jgi:predicted nucleic acid-binding protein
VSAGQFLVDTSGLIRLLRNEDVQARWRGQLAAGLVRVCPVTELEFLYTAQSAARRAQLVEQVDAAFVWTDMPPDVFHRATQVQAALTQRGLHRSAGPVDLLLAAAAELLDLTVLHYDRDFEQVAKVTGQPQEWVAPAGSVS